MRSAPIRMSIKTYSRHSPVTSLCATRAAYSWRWATLDLASPSRYASLKLTFGLSILLYTQGNWDIHAKVPVNLCVMETNTSLDRAHLQKLRGHVHDLATHILRYELPENVICRTRCDAPIEPVMQ